ncbi:efflux transporter outer membrane subunit [Paroceanicella profunda]|uniref:efflux transporter outer membrane subunit n=1 Tax=Paroceanicella profunda TaxID=2579971 RepID=UPI00197EDDEA|nr:efflux transporter outer membrane subunit [Paroceanicella profunda]
MSPAPLSVARPRRAVLLLLACTALAGCVVGPDYETPKIDVPDRFGADTATTPRPAELSRWWTRMDDPMLDAMISEAVEGNLDVASAKAAIREARATLRQTGGTLAPQVDASTSATRQDGGSNTSAGQTSNSNFQAGFDASWELDLFGANRRSIEAARYGLDAANEDLRATLLTLVGDVATYYVQARGFQARIKLAERTARSQRETAALTRAQFEAGASSALDVANATGQAASTEAAIPTLQISFAESVHRLSILTGKPPAALMGRMAEDKPIPEPRLPMPAGVPAQVLMARPDIRVAERQLAQSTALIGVAEAARWPDVSLSGTISTSASTFGNLFEASSIAWSVGPSLSVPIFNGGQLKAGVEIAQAQRDQSYIAFRSSILTALEDVENSLFGLTREQERYDKLDTSARAYRRAAALSRSLYQTGSSSFLDVLDAERSLYSAEDTLLQSQINIATYYIALNKALGGGWDGQIDSTRPEIVDTYSGPRLAYQP